MSGDIVLEMKDLQKIYNTLKTAKDKSIVNELLKKNYISDEDGIDISGIGYNCNSFYIESIVLFNPKLVYKDTEAILKETEEKNKKLEIAWLKGVGLDTLKVDELEEICPKIGSNIKWSRPKRISRQIEEPLEGISKKVGGAGYIHIFMRDNEPIISIRSYDKWIEPLEVNSTKYINNIIEILTKGFNELVIKEVYWQDCGVGEYITRVHSDKEVTISIY